MCIFYTPIIRHYYFLNGINMMLKDLAIWMVARVIDIIFIAILVLVIKLVWFG